MSNMALFIALGITGAASAGRDMRRFGDTGVQAANRVATAWKNGGNIMSDSMRGMARAATMVGGFSAVKSIISDVAAFEKGLSELRQTGQLSRQEIAAIRKDILSGSRDVLQLPEAQLAAYQRMIASGLNPALAKKSMKFLSIAASGSFTELEDMAKTGIDLLDKMDIKPEGMTKALDTLIMASRLGKFEMKDLARYMPMVASDMSRFGITGQRGVAQMAAMLEVSNKTTAQPEEAANNMKNFFAAITRYSKGLKKGIGFDVWEYIDPNTSRIRAGKNIEDFFQGLIKKSGGSMAKLEAAGVADMQAKSFIQAMMQNYSEYESIRDKALNTPGAAQKSFDEIKDDTWAGLKRSEIDKSVAFKSDNASKGATIASRAISGATGWAVDNPGKATAIGAGGLAAGYAALRMFRGFIAGRGVGGVVGGALGGAGKSPLPVYVVNKHLSMLPGKGWGFPGKETAGALPTVAGARAAALARLATMGRIGSVLAGGAMAIPGLTFGTALAAGTAGFAAGNYLEKNFIKGRIGEALYDLINGDNQNLSASSAKNEIHLQMQIDSQGRTLLRSDNMNTSIKGIDKRGDFFAALTSTEAM